jgi:diacylglycerol kinase (ATP)
MNKLAPHPTLAGERVLAVLSPSNIDRLPQCKALLGAVFPRLDVVSPASLEHLRETVLRSAATHRIVLAVGGDGTLHQVLNAIDLQRQAVGIIPAGTGNDFVRTLGIPNRFQPAIASLHKLTLQPTDFGIINGMRYHNSAGLGLDSATLRLRAERKNWLTRNYNIAFLMALAGLECPMMTISFDGESVSGRYYWLLAMNTPFIGGGTPVAPRASTSDGLLDLVLIRETSKLNLLRYMPATLRGQHLGLPMTTFRQVRRVTCETETAMDYLAVDGELHYCGERRISFEVRPGGMQFLR